MPEPADRPPLRDQIAEALYRHTMDHAAGGPARLLTRDETVLWENSLARADAVMPVIEAETAALRQRAEQAERKLTEALDQIATERRARLAAAEAAVRRSREALARFNGRGVITPDGTDWNIPTAAEVLDAWRAALDAEQPKETP